ncbi:MAG: dTMP kinase [Candidatus Omnitrophota bacterium]|jgi:dTMP kinase
MAAKSLKKGVFITFEGVEGCGKSTQSKLLYDELKKTGYACVHTREPGGTKTGEEIRKVLLHSKVGNITALTELLLFEACRAEIVDEVIRPAIKSKRIVICDRFSDATMSYQGYGGKVPLNIIRAVDTVATGALQPDITILLDIDIVTGLRRARSKGVDRMESKDISYHRAVRNGYLKLAKKYPGRIKVIKVREGIEAVQEKVRREVEIVIQKYKRAG